ncbi:MAG: glycosyltransferase family 39 protein [Algoriphagus sp.]|uniref:ArnT family glycosyltransferase n=1 Tax=Algoriphagus sp. TaxID=1872435 RepID=UPI0017BB01D6|nr:glycosyltransferase family 39 protein [Algoriphagus sp.]NVJ84953.1 glycosyltransferase family 39 protein [Algoriphagus sp.]
MKIVFTLRPEIDLFTEEAHYWLWSEHLAWHYYSKPPLIALFNYLSTSLLGVNELAVRIIPAILGMGTAWLTFLLTDYLFQSKKQAFWASMMLSSMPFFQIFSTFHLTDSEVTFFGLLTWYLLAKALEKKTWFLWVIAGFVGALGIASKPIFILAIPTFALYLLHTKNLIPNLKGFILFIIIFLIGFLPSLIWNLENEFQTFKHLATLGGVHGDPSIQGIGEAILSFLGYLGGQLGMVSIFLLPLWVLYFRKVKVNDPKQLFLILPALVSFSTFLFMSWITSVEVNWPAFSYPTLAIALAHEVEKESGKWKKFRNWGVALGLSFLLLLILPDHSGWKKFTGIEKVEIPVFKRLAGYEQLTSRINFLQDSLGIEASYFFSESYHTSSEMAFYLSNHPKTYQINIGGRKTQFDLWEGIESEIGKEKIGVFVSSHQDSPELVTKFEELLYEEEYPVFFRDVYLRSTKIQFWRNIQDYHPVNSDSY